MRNQGLPIALSGCILAALLGGCGGLQGSPAGSLPSSAVAENPASRSTGAMGDLLYVAHASSIYDKHTFVSILSLPQGKVVAQISLGALSGMCSDTGGNVWLIVYRSNFQAYYAEKYAHGGTQPIAQIRMPKYYKSGCAVDPSSGDLAIMNPAGGSQEGHGSIDVWAGARPGKPAVYDVPFTPENAAYDDAGNLFFDGCACANSDPGLLFGELVKDSRAVAAIRLDKNTALPGGVQWDGHYIALQTGGYQPYLKGRPRIYRIEASGGLGHVVGIVIPKDTALTGTAWFATYGSSVVATTKAHRGQIDIWPYPAGGPHTHIVGRFGDVRGLVISFGH
ncbi:MAG: hypothetical protein JOZ77_10575 [Candidatus Eremiobacteraeota bacterium]|nr:hypothetical protein [Candidatus Eremiobacteraeota bacterium]